MTAWTIGLGGPLIPDGPSMSSQILVFALWAIGALVVGFLVFVSREDDFAVRN
jgi:hypothetical protein